MFDAAADSIKRRLLALPGWLFIVYVGASAFLTYVSMYAYRRPFTSATFEEVGGWDYALDFKTVLLISQVIGYALSKFIGIKVISEMTPARRGQTLFMLIMLAWLALLLLPILPVQVKFVALFLNGLPLGMIWGLVFSFLEGRRITEAVGAMLCASFIFGSGIVKSVGSWLLIEGGVAELWMPFITGGVFVLPLLFSVIALSLVPPPTSEDIALRQERVPLDGAARLAFFKTYWGGLIALIVAYVCLTAMRDFADNFAAEIWIALGYGESPEIFALTSLPITLFVLVFMGSLMLIKNNLKAFTLNLWMVTTGFVVVILCTLFYELNLLGGLPWFVLLTTGLYLSYIPFNCILFERLIAVTSSLGNAGFLIYLADSFGYLGSVQILIFKSMFQPDLSWIRFLMNGAYAVGAVGLVATGIAIMYFHWRLKHEDVQVGQLVTA